MQDYTTKLGSQPANSTSAPSADTDAAELSHTMGERGGSLLITGASGFVGSHLVEEGLQQGMEVWAAVRGSSSKRWLTDPRIHFIELNLGSDEALRQQLEEHVKTYGAWDHVIHAAGLTKTKNTDDFYRVNTQGTERLARLLLQTQALKGRFVFVSSLSIMGALHEDDYAPIRAEEPAQPNTAYGRSKMEAEQRLAAIPELDYVTLRPTGIYGPREMDYKIMADSIRQHIDFAVGYKQQIITFVYVADVVQAAFKALTRGTTGKAYILSDGHDYNSRAFSDLIQSTLGVRCVLHIKAPLWFLKFVCRLGIHPTLNMDKYFILSQRNWRCDIQPARQELGYEPEWPLKRGVEACREWYLSK